MTETKAHNTPALVCPPWCTTPAEEHASDLAIPYNDATFHRSAVVDAWQTPHQYPDKLVNIEVRVRTWEDVSTGRRETAIDIDGDLGRGSEDYSELEVGDARRLAQALLMAADLIEDVRA